MQPKPGRERHRLWPLALLPLLLLARGALACSCIPPHLLVRQFDQAVAIFAGTVTEALDGGRTARVAVQQRWIGPSGAELLVSNDGAPCGVSSFPPASRWLFVASRQTNDGRLIVSGCQVVPFPVADATLRNGLARLRARP